MSNRTLAALLAALTLLSLVPEVPAQSLGADIVPHALHVVTPTVGVAAQVELVVRNRGGEDFNAGGTPWEVFFGFNGTADNDCLTPPARPNSDCHQIRTEQVGRDGGETRISIPWTPNEAHRGLVQIHVELRSVPCLRDQQGYCAPDGGPSANSVQVFTIFVADPWVRAAPVERTISLTGDSVNDPWTRQQILDTGLSCPAAPTPTVTACRAVPTQLVAMQFRVKNEGNAQDSYFGRYVDEPGERNLTDLGYQFFFSPSAFTLDAGRERIVTVSVLIPRDELSYLNAGTPEAGINVGRVKTVVQWSSELNPAITTNTISSNRAVCTDDLLRQGLCQDPALPSVLIGVKRDIYAESNETYRLVRANEVSTYNITINNTGNAPDTYQVVLKSADPQTTINGSWTAIVQQAATNPSSPGVIGARQIANASISIVPPMNATRGFHTFVVEVASTQATDGKFVRLVFVAELEQRFGISGGAVTSLQRVVPGEVASYQMFLSNDANGPDNVTIELQNVPSGWTRTLEPSGPVLTIPAFGSVPIWLNVTPPPNTANDTEAAFFLNATSQSFHARQDDPVRKASIKTFLTVLRGPNLEVLHRGAREAFVDPQGTIAFELDVRNIGNVDDNYTVSYAPAVPGWVVTLEPSTLALAPLQTGVVRVTLRAPGQVDIGESQRFFVTLRSSVDPAARFQTVNVTARISGPDLFVSDVTVEGLDGADGASPYSGDRLSLGVVLGNRGNQPPMIDGEPVNATLTLDYLVGETPTLIGQGRYTLSPATLAGGRRDVFRVEWNTTGVSGPVTLRARIDADDAIREIEEGPGSNEARRPITLRTFDIDVEAPAPLSGRPGEIVSYGERPNVFHVVYRGNQPNEPVTIRLQSENGWASREFEIGLPQQAIVPLPIDVQIPAEPGVPSDRLTLTVIPTLRPRSAITTSVVTTVVDDAKPRILDVAVTPDPVEIGETATISAIVRDETGLSAVRAIVVASGGDESTTTIALQAEGNGRYSAPASFDAAGTYRYYVEAVDRSANANRNDTTDVLRTFRVSAGSAPVVKLADGHPSVIRATTPIRLQIVDEQPIAKATYTIRGVESDLPRPFQIDTTGFQEGPVDVSVTATNIYGAEGSGRFTLTIDNTPPAIRKATGPTEAKINEDVTIRIETDTDAQSVEVAVKRGGQIVETLNATRRSPGVWEVVLRPGEGENRLDVTARDAAGNANLQRDAVVLTATRAGFLGVAGFELVAAALAIAGVAAARRRRE